MVEAFVMPAAQPFMAAGRLSTGGRRQVATAVSEPPQEGKAAEEGGGEDKKERQKRHFDFLKVRLHGGLRPSCSACRPRSWSC
jgi:hypothetical protein